MASLAQPNTKQVVYRIVKIAALMLALLFLIMRLLSYSFYTSFGIDSEKAAGSAESFAYYRLRWPGNGSFWVGGGTIKQPASGHSLKRFDFAGVFFQSPRRPHPRSFWNRVGFWFVHRALDDAPETPFEPVTTAELWIGCPGWLPAVLLSVTPVWDWARARRLAHKNAGTGYTPTPDA